MRYKALEWAARGLHVFPLPYGKKAPPPKGWIDKATTDPEKIREMFPEDKRLNIGIFPGKSGHVVIDVDGPVGRAKLREILGGPAPETLIWQTGREGGLHLLYRLPGEALLRSRRVAEELDVKCHKGYVVVPPSKHPSGEDYRFIREQSIATLYDDLFTKLAEATKPARREGQQSSYELQAPSLDLLELLVDNIPNDGRFERSAYIKMGAAIKAAWPSDEDAAWALWADWCGRWTEGTNDIDEMRHDWEGLHPPFSIGWSWLMHVARSAGFEIAPHIFAEFTEEPDLENLGVIDAYRLMRDPELTTPPPEVLPNLGYKGRLTFFWGGEKTGKSTTCRSMAVEPLCNGSKMVWFDYEEGRGQWALGSAQDQELKDRVPPEAFFYAWSPASWTQVKQIVEIIQPEIIVVDSLTSSVQILEGDLPKPGESERWMEHMKKWKALATDKAGNPLRGIIVLGHSVREGHRYAGSHGKGAGADFKLGLRELDSGLRKLFSDGGRAGFTFDPLYLSLQGNGHVKVVSRKDTLTDEQRDIIDYVSTHPGCSRSEIRDALSIQKMRVVQHVKVLIDEEILEEPERGALQTVRAATDVFGGADLADMEE